MTDLDLKVYGDTTLVLLDAHIIKLLVLVRWAVTAPFPTTLQGREEFPITGTIRIDVEVDTPVLFVNSVLHVRNPLNGSSEMVFRG